MFRRPILLLLCALLACGTADARNGGEALNHYGLVTLSDQAVGARLAARFKARGQPVFLIHDLNAGLGQNDIMRFSDKAVLIDGDVWSTLLAEGALDKLRAAPLVRVQGRSTSASWAQRADLVNNERQRKAYKVGAELLRVLEENFGGAPQGQQLTVIFEQNHLTLLAPTAFLDQLRFSVVRKVTGTGKPTIISLPPDSLPFAGQPFTWRAWAADPADPSGDLTYQLLGTLPPGLVWNAGTHSVTGQPTVPGRWRVAVVARNASDLRDTLTFTLRVRPNQAPVLAGEPRAVAVVERAWNFKPLATDADHPGEALTVTPGILPPGMTFHPDSGLSWTPPATAAGRRHDFSLFVSDPLGARREFPYTLQVVAKDGILLSEGVKIELPWDTLLVGRTYVWRTRAITTAWEGQGIRLLGVRGSDSTLQTSDSLVVIPRQPGAHTLEFRFTAQGRALTQTLSLPVRHDLPPEFVTELPEWNLRTGAASRAYRPVAVDPEGEKVTLQAAYPTGSPLTWDGTRLRFDPARAGAWPARIVAQDAGGQTAQQWVLFESHPRRANSHFIVESRVHGAFTAWTAAMDFGTGRLGLYTPNFSYGVVPRSHWLFRETPFVFFGGNLMGEQSGSSEVLANVLWADLGLAFRNPAPRIFAGGLYMRLNGEWHFPGSPLSWVEMEVTGHMHHVMAATDSGTFATLLLDTTDIIARDTLSLDGPLSRLIRDGFRKDNVRFHTRVEALGPIGWGFYAGPTMWREDVPIAGEHDQRFGAALRFRGTPRGHLYQFTLRGGWGPGGDGWGAYGSLRVALARP